MKAGAGVSRLFAVVLLFAAPAALARVVLYVDGMHGSDNNNCQSKQTACKTIGHAISLAGPGYVIKVATAMYQENLTINFDLGIIGSGSSNTVVDGGGTNTVITIPNNNTRVALVGLTISGGVTDSGGGIVNNGGIVTIYDSFIVGNIAEFGEGESDGGGILNTGTLTLNNSTVSENQVTGDYYANGGGIYNTGSLTINDSTVAGNLAVTAQAAGAGIFNGGTLVVNRSTISGNQGAEGDYPEGAGIDNADGTASITNSTIYANQGGFGGGISNGGGTVTVSSSTINANIGQFGAGGISGGVTIQNSILAGNAHGNCDRTVTSDGYNLSDDTTCNLTGPGDLNNTGVKLGPLQNNGGPTQTVEEFLGDPTIDAGNPNGCADSRGHLLTTDQRGSPRPGQFKHDKRCDMGAFERQND